MREIANLIYAGSNPVPMSNSTLDARRHTVRYLKKNEMFIDNFPTYNFKGFVYAPSTHAGKIYHTVYKNFRYVMIYPESYKCSIF